VVGMFHCVWLLFGCDDQLKIGGGKLS